MEGSIVSPLVSKLKEVEECVEIPETEIVNSGWGEKMHPLLEEVESLACDFLINSNGTPNFKNHRLMKEAGYPVSAGETDSFGWLTGLIRTKKGMVCYG